MTKKRRIEYIKEVSSHLNWPGDSRFFLQFLIDEHSEEKLEATKTIDVFLQMAPEAEIIEKTYNIQPPTEIKCFKKQNKNSGKLDEKQFKDCAAPKKLDIKNVETQESLPGKTIIGPYHLDKIATSLSSIGDINQDGFGDFAVGISSAFSSGRESGEVYILLGFKDLNIKKLDLSKGALERKIIHIIGASSYDAVGEAIAGMGDFDGDGKLDIAFSAPQYFDSENKNRPGAVYVITELTDGMLTIDLQNFVIDNKGFLIIGPGDKFFFGHDIVFVGDFNGDGFGDLAVSAVFDDKLIGTVCIVEGRVKGNNPIIRIDEAAISGVKTIKGLAEAGLFGFSLAAAGDVDGDGYSDLAVSSPFETVENITNTGIVRVFFGGKNISEELSVADCLIRINGSQKGALFGYEITFLGDFFSNKGMYLAVGSPLYSFEKREYSGAVFLIALDSSEKSININSASNFYVMGPKQKSFLGTSIDSAGDFNGDGHIDLLVSTHLSSDGNLTNNGAVYIVSGISLQNYFYIDLEEIIEKEQGVILEGSVHEGFAGKTIAGGGADFDGDGVADIIFSVPGESFEARYLCGYLYIMTGYESDIL